jgi:pre-rRNA-processing protein TSR1
MFYNPLDVRWFKPAELSTLLGLRGHIRESVGTHGLYKAIFSGAITQNDQVMLVLYKRVYPKIPEESDIPLGQETQQNTKGWKLLAW